jgi:glycosyltransferase A (GT-A) superfamily protein (DUF2064 family)
LQRYQQVIVIGSDSPQLTADRLQQAIRALEKEQFIVGPALDGGCYLFAGRSHLSQAFWTQINYSRVDTCDKLLAALPVKARLLAPMTDMDRIEDLPQLHRELTALGSAISPQQRALVSWIEAQGNYR